MKCPKCLEEAKVNPNREKYISGGCTVIQYVCNGTLCSVRSFTVKDLMS